MWHDSIPVLLVENNVDLKDRMVPTGRVTFHKMTNISYVDISVNTTYNVEKQFIFLLQKLIGCSRRIDHPQLVNLPP